MTSAILKDDFCVKATLNAILSGKIRDLNGFKIIISHEPGSQRLLNLEEKAIKRKLKAYISTYLKVNDIMRTKNMSLNQVLEVYRYDMQGILIDINVEEKTIYIIDGQQRLTLHFVVLMYLNIYALKFRDKNLSNQLQSNAGVKINEKFTFTQPNLNIKTLNEFTVEKTTAEGETEFEQVSDLMKVLNLYNHSINYFKSKNDFSINDFVNNMFKKFELEENKHNSMYLSFIKTVFSNLEEMISDTKSLIMATNLIRVTVNVKSPFDSISEALIKQGIKAAVMNSSIFALTSMFQNINSDPEAVISFNNIYQKIMTRTDNIEVLNDFFFQILVSKHENQYFVSKDIDSVSNIFHVVEQIMAYKHISGLTLLKELEEISDLYFSLTKSKAQDTNKKYRLEDSLDTNLVSHIKSKNYELLYGLDRLLNEHGLDQKSFFILIPFVITISKIYKEDNKLGESLLCKSEKFIRTINLFLFSKKESINNLKGVQAYFSYLAGLMLSVKNKQEFLKNIELDNLSEIKLTDLELQSLLKSLETNAWKGGNNSVKSYLRECQLGNVDRIQHNVNKEFTNEYKELSERKTCIDTILDRYFTKGKGNSSEELDHYESKDKKRPTSYQEKIYPLNSLHTITSKKNNRIKGKEGDITVLSRDQYTSNQWQYSNKSGLTTNKEKDTLILHKYLHIEKMKDFFVRNSDIIVFTNNYITESIGEKKYDIVYNYAENSFDIDYSINKIFLHGYKKQEA